VNWRGSAEINGHSWPVSDGETVWLPAGRYRLQPASEPASLRLLHLTGDLLSAAARGEYLEFRYRSSARAIALLDQRPSEVQVDGQQVQVNILKTGEHWTVILPPGQHRVLFRVGV
jgi:hypothetical protein